MALIIYRNLRILFTLQFYRKNAGRHLFAPAFPHLSYRRCSWRSMLAGSLFITCKKIPAHFLTRKEYTFNKF